MDAVDRRILSELDMDARVSYSGLGRRIRVSKETVKYRITQLEKRGIIRGYYTTIDFSKLGYIIYRLYLRLQSTTPEIEKELIRYLAASRYVSVLYETNGPFHIAMGVWARDMWEYEGFWNDLKERFGTHIKESRLSLMCEYLEFSRPYLLSSRHGTKTAQGKEIFVTVSKSPPEKLDQTDLRMLAYLSNNARASLVQLSAHLDLSIVAARHRLRSCWPGGSLQGSGRYWT